MVAATPSAITAQKNLSHSGINVVNGTINSQRVIVRAQQAIAATTIHRNVAVDHIVAGVVDDGPSTGANTEIDVSPKSESPRTAIEHQVGLAVGIGIDRRDQINRLGAKTQCAAVVNDDRIRGRVRDAARKGVRAGKIQHVGAGLVQAIRTGNNAAQGQGTGSSFKIVEARLEIDGVGQRP